MEFKKIQLNGFKSFADKTDLLIENGLTGIVGPNGCGKSNIVESLRWCMGETSAKSMRGSGMEDVIFSGTSNKPSKNIAEVSIALSNENKDGDTLEDPALNSNNDNNSELKPPDVDQPDKTREKLKNRYGVRKYRIQEVIRPGQVLLVQVMKEERGQKGAALTTFLSLAGKYIVLMPNTAKGGGISRKIFNYEDRNRIREILKNIDIPTNMGLIVRTAGARKTKNEIDNDLQNTIGLWENIKDKAINSTAPLLIHEEGDVIKRALRDIYDNDTKYIHVEGNEGYQKAKSFMKEFMPRNSKFVKKYRGKIPLFLSLIHISEPTRPY